MAGESPDRSKQQKSSGTARSEGDPRLRLTASREPSAEGEAGGRTDTATAVFRTGSSGDGERGEGGGSGKVDTATAVFKARPSDDSENSEDSQGSEQPEGSGAQEGSSDADGAEGAEGTEGTGGAAEGLEGASESSEAAEPLKNVKNAGNVDNAESPEDADVTEPADGAGSRPVVAAAPEEGDARLRVAVAARAAKDDEGDKGPKDDGAKAAKSESEAVPDAGAGAAVEGDAPEPVTPADGASDEATASGDADVDAAVEPSDEARVTGTRDETAATEGARDAENEEEAEASEAEAKGTAVADKTDTAEDKRDTAEDKTETAEDKRDVDQPTAVFRAPAADQVDHPTTALKITPPASKPGPESKPESAAERTSKFVPLRGDDVRPAPAPKPRKPETPAAASAATPGARGVAPSFSGAERTTQQPVPPKPPLDLLAELTNTPPPPQTPVRTAVRRVKIWTPLVLLLLIIFAIAQIVRPLPDPELRMSAKPTYTFKGSKPSLPWPDEGQGYMAATGLGTVDSFGEQKPVPIGSVAKAMTAYVVLKDHPLKKGEEGPSITVDAKAESEGKLDAVGESTLNTVKEGDKLTEKQALSAIMIPSANNIARLLARWDAGSEKAFVKKMNDTAKSLGMKNTTYTDPSGLHETTVSTAEDQVKLGQKLVEIPALMAITILPSWTDPSGKTHPNYNRLVPYDGALGIKTGSTTKAGGNLLFAAHKMVGDTDQLIVGAVLGQHKPSIIDTVNAVSKEVMLATQDLLEGAKVVKKGDVVGTVSDGLGGSTPVVATKDVTAVGWPGLTVKLELTDDGKTIPHSAAAGTHVGTLTVGEGTSQVKVPVALQSDMAEPAIGDKLTRIS
ncbi:D-alanyl-D-alanine carboxypeptidase [Streptomyces sp. NPDC018000]|uniref:D-alanyl-D-alanine carboxypeptidase n=1 Tax=Streptomyces sp. NPDC018000 TaxID=3365028 RepID=UPI0037B7DC14